MSSYVVRSCRLLWYEGFSAAPCDVVAQGRGSVRLIRDIRFHSCMTRNPTSISVASCSNSSAVDVRRARRQALSHRFRLTEPPRPGNGWRLGSVGAAVSAERAAPTPQQTRYASYRSLIQPDRRTQDLEKGRLCPNAVTRRHHFVLIANSSAIAPRISSGHGVRATQRQLAVCAPSSPRSEHGCCQTGGCAIRHRTRTRPAKLAAPEGAYRRDRTQSRPHRHGTHSPRRGRAHLASALRQRHQADPPRRRLHPRPIPIRSAAVR